MWVMGFKNLDQKKATHGREQFFSVYRRWGGGELDLGGWRE